MSSHSDNVGYVDEIKGQILLVSGSGVVKIPEVGDPIVAGDYIVTRDGSSLTIVNKNGSTITVPPNAKLFVPENSSEVTLEMVDSSGTSEFPDSIDAPESKDLDQEMSEVIRDQTGFDSLILRDDDGSLGILPTPAQDDDIARSQPDPFDGRTLSFGVNISSEDREQSTFDSPGRVIVSPIDLPSGNTSTPLENQDRTPTIRGVQINTGTTALQERETIVEPDDSTPPEPEPEPEATLDFASAIFGQTLVQQTGILENDTGSNISLLSISGSSVDESGPTTINGRYGTLTVQPDGTYVYDSSNFDLHSGLAAFWSFDESVGATAATDHASVDRITDTATLQNNARIVSGGASGNALQLDGTGDHATIRNSVEINAPSDGVIEARTISLSFQPASSTSMTERQVLYEEGGDSSGFVIYIHNNMLYAGAYNGTEWAGQFFSASLLQLNTSQWHNISLALDSTTGVMEAWLNGQSIGSTGTAQAVNAQRNEARLGGSSGSNIYHDGEQSGSFNFEGLIDEVRLYNRALNAYEVNALASQTETPSESFSYTIQDENGATATASLTLNLSSPANSAPIAVNDTLSVMSDQTVSVNSVFGQGLLGNDGDPDGNVLSVTQVGDTAVSSSGATTVTGTLGTLIIAADGTYSYAPLSGGSGGTDTFTYTVNDGITTSTASLVVNVIPDGAANADTVTIQESALPDGSIYVIERDADNSRFFLTVLDVETGVSQQLGDINGLEWSSAFYSGLGRAPDGTLYLADQNNLYTLDPSTQTLSVVGAHGIFSMSPQTLGIFGLTVSPAGIIYANTETGIYTLNTSTGAATLLGELPDQTATLIYSSIEWHNGALYSSYSALRNSAYVTQLARIEPSEDSFAITTLPETYEGTGPFSSLTSLGGELIGVNFSSMGTSVSAHSIDASTGVATPLHHDVGLSLANGALTATETASGNVLTNDPGGHSVEHIMLPDGSGMAVGSSGVTLQGVYGTLHIKRDGSYEYRIDNSLEATDSLNAGDTGSDRFLYTTGTGADTSQSTLTVFVNGSTDIQVSEAAAFTDATLIDSVDLSRSGLPIDFEVVTSSPLTKITELRIESARTGTTFNIPSVLTDTGTVTTSNDGFVWVATPGENAGLDSFDAVSAGLNIASTDDRPSVQNYLVTAVTSDYGEDGTVSSSHSSSSSITISLREVDNVRAGNSGDNTLTGSSTQGSQDDEIIGGAGDDTITSGTGNDFLVWRAEDTGTSSSPAVDTVTDFDVQRGGDVLDLRDLLPEHVEDHLDEYLSFSFAEGDTTISVSTAAGGPVVQNIVLDGVDLSAEFGTTDVIQITDRLTNNGNLLS